MCARQRSRQIGLAAQLKPAGGKQQANRSAAENAPERTSMAR
jgi:hypothetical protein